MVNGVSSVHFDICMYVNVMFVCLNKSSQAPLMSICNRITNAKEWEREREREELASTNRVIKNSI